MKKIELNIKPFSEPAIVCRRQAINQNESVLTPCYWFPIHKHLLRKEIFPSHIHCACKTLQHWSLRVAFTCQYHNLVKHLIGSKALKKSLQHFCFLWHRLVRTQMCVCAYSCVCVCLSRPEQRLIFASRSAKASYASLHKQTTCIQATPIQHKDKAHIKVNENQHLNRGTASVWLGVLQS